MEITALLFCRWLRPKVKHSFSGLLPKAGCEIAAGWERAWLGVPCSLPGRGGPLRRPGQGVPAHPWSLQESQLKRFLLFLPALLNDSGFDETPQEAPSLKKTEIWCPQASFEGGVSVPASANRKADGCQLNLGLRRWLSAALGGGSLPHLVP